jgi:hypothetical protein
MPLSTQARVNKTLGLKLLGFQHQISMQYFRLLLIVRLNSRWFMLVMHVMTVHVCTYLIMLKQLSAGAGVFGKN